MTSTEPNTDFMAAANCHRASTSTGCGRPTTADGEPVERVYIRAWDDPVVDGLG